MTNDVWRYDERTIVAFTEDKTVWAKIRRYKFAKGWRIMAEYRNPKGELIALQYRIPKEQYRAALRLFGVKSLSD